MNKAELGRVGECVAETFLKQRGFSVWRPDEFIRLLELAVVYGVANGECKHDILQELIYIFNLRGACGSGSSASA